MNWLWHGFIMFDVPPTQHSVGLGGRERSQRWAPLQETAVILVGYKVGEWNIITIATGPITAPWGTTVFAE